MNPARVDRQLKPRECVQHEGLVMINYHKNPWTAARVMSLVVIN